MYRLQRFKRITFAYGTGTLLLCRKDVVDSNYKVIIFNRILHDGGYLFTVYVKLF